MNEIIAVVKLIESITILGGMIYISEIARRHYEAIK